MRLRVLEGKPTRPLIHTRLPANPSIRAGKQNAPQRNRCEEARAQNRKRERQDARLRPHAVGVEGVCSVEEGRGGERRERIGRFGVFDVGGDGVGCTDGVSLILIWRETGGGRGANLALSYWIVVRCL